MPTIYASGTPNSDGYLSGISVPTANALLTNIRDTLIAAGWTVDSSQIAGNKLKSVGVDGSHNCWLLWEVVLISGNEFVLSIRGDLNGAGTILSPDLVRLPFFEGAQARLYLTADAGAGCIYIQNGAAGGKSAHFGFLERLTTSAFSWMVALLTNREDFSYMAKDIWNVNWAEMSRYWSNFSSTTYHAGAKQHLWDGYTVAMMPLTGSFNDAGANNAAYFSNLGAVDAVTGLPILSDYGYLIGKNNATSDYVATVGKAKPMHFPGRVRFARTGLASVDAGDQFTVGTKTVISGGEIGVYQGFVIKDTAS